MRSTTVSKSFSERSKSIGSRFLVTLLLLLAGPERAVTVPDGLMRVNSCRAGCRKLLHEAEYGIGSAASDAAGTSCFPLTSEEARS
jgi:hypothetical protein